MRVLAGILISLIVLSAAAQQPAVHETGTVFIVNISEHRMTKLEIRDGKQSLVKIERHQFAEVSLPVGEHVLSPKNFPKRNVVLKISANSKHYVVCDYGVKSYFPTVIDAEIRETTPAEFYQWLEKSGLATPAETRPH